MTDRRASHSKDGHRLLLERNVTKSAKKWRRLLDASQTETVRRPTGDSNVLPVHVTKTHRRRGDTAPLFLNLGTRWMLVVNFTLRPPYPRKQLQYLWNRKLSGLHSRSGPLEMRNMSCIYWHSNPGSSSRQPSHYTDTVSRLSGPAG